MQPMGIAYFRRCRDVIGEEDREVRIPSTKEALETIIPKMQDPDCLILVYDRLVQVQIPELQNQNAILAVGIDNSKGKSKQCLLLGSCIFYPSSAYFL